MCDKRKPPKNPKHQYVFTEKGGPEVDLLKQTFFGGFPKRRYEKYDLKKK